MYASLAGDVGMTPRPLPLPPGWTEETLDGGRLGVSEGRFAWSARASRRRSSISAAGGCSPSGRSLWPFIPRRAGPRLGRPRFRLSGRPVRLPHERRRPAGTPWWGKRISCGHARPCALAGRARVRGLRKSADQETV